MTRDQAVQYAGELEAEARRLDANLVKFPTVSVARLLLPLAPHDGREILLVFSRGFRGSFRFSGLVRMLEYCRAPYDIFAREYKPGPLEQREALEALYRCTEIWDYQIGGFIPLDETLRRPA